MNREPEPEFLSREIIDAIHEEQIDTYGGIHGVRDENGLESAIAAARNVYHYGDGDVFEVAAAYAYHLAESQAYLDGNKRTGAQAAFVFLEGCGIDCSGLPDEHTYAAMIDIATHKLSRSDLAEYFRSTLGPER
jgi:death-on-curing protein